METPIVLTEACDRAVREDPAIDDFLKKERQRPLSSVTIRHYRYDLQELDTFLWGGGDKGVKTLLKATKLDIDGFIAHLKDEGLKRNTIRRKITALSVFYKWAHGDGRMNALLQPGLSELRKMRPDCCPRIVPPAHHLVDSIATALRSDLRNATKAQELGRSRNLAIFLLMVSTGMPLSTLLNLTLKDWIYCIKTGALNRMARTHGIARRIRVTPSSDAISAVEGYLDVVYPDRRECPLVGNKLRQKLIIASDRGAISERTTRRLLEVRLGRMKVPGITPTKIRHYYAARRVREGVRASDLALELCVSLTTAERLIRAIIR